jgi:hypothetical protein
MMGKLGSPVSPTTATSNTPQVTPGAAHEQDAPEGVSASIGTVSGKPPTRKRTLLDRLDIFGSRLSTKSNFWHRLFSMIWLPYAFRSGIRMKRLGPNTFSAVLPFKRINRNWYNAMAGAALLANSEIAGGMYLFSLCEGEFTVVCKELTYKFLRPCHGPAIYKITPRDDVKALVNAGREFNATLDLDVVQQFSKGGKDRRVGRCSATFHLTPKAHQQAKGRTIR